MPAHELQKHMKQSLLDSLGEVPLFQRCDDSDLQRLVRYMKETTFGPREFIMKQGTEGRRFYVVVEGLCDVLINGQVVGKLQSGDYCGELALIQNTTRSASIKAIKTVRAFWIDKATFKRVLQNDMELVFYHRGGVKPETFSATPGSAQQKAAEAGKPLTHPSQAETRWLLQAVQTNVLFRHLTSAERRYVVQQMYKQNVARAEVLIKEGDTGDKFYVIRSGRFKITQAKKGLVRYVTTRDCIGELALIYDAPRSATVTAMSNGIVWVIDRAMLRYHVRELAQNKNSQLASFLKKVPLLSSLLSHEFGRIAGEMQEEKFEEGQKIISHGERGDKFYVLKSGQVAVFDSEESFGEGKPLRILKEGAYFGERALITKEPRSATLLAHEGPVECYSLTKQKFELLLGPLSELMDRHMKENYSAVQNQAKAEPVLDMDVTQKLDELNDLGRIGVGGYGVVKMVKDPNTKKVFALKCVRKDLIVWNKQQKQIKSELKVMKMISGSPFIVNLWQTYQDGFRVYFLLDIAMGGDLFHYMKAAPSFSGKQVRFYAACVVEALDFIHNRGIAYRDLKPENMVICSNGYVKLADFGLAKHVDGTKTYTVCGTPDYLSPESILGRGHDYSVDWWGLGILIYEMIAKVPPFMARPDRIADKILSAKPKFTYLFSMAAQDIISQLLKKNPTERLGVTPGGAQRIREHPWFENFDWAKLRKQQTTAPYIPNVNGIEDNSNFKMSIQPDPSQPTAMDAHECWREF